VTLPSSFPSCSSILQQVEPFFQKPEEKKTPLEGPYGFGYSSFSHKEGIRVLTGYRLHSDFIGQNLVPEEWKELYQKLASELDKITMQVSLSLSEPLFGRKAPSVAHRGDLPVAYGPHFGMLDTAYYYNKLTVEPPPIGTSINDVNCVPHFDPGLLSLSFLSNCEGLQLQDENGKWIYGPVNTIPGQENIGVIWLGEAAVKASKIPLKAGIHRVVYPSTPIPRLTLWYEMCTVKQATEPEDEYINADSVKIPNMPGSKALKVKKGDKKIDILKKIERKRGVPMSKVRRIDDSFKSWGPDSD